MVEVELARGGGGLGVGVAYRKSCLGEKKWKRERRGQEGGGQRRGSLTGRWVKPDQE